MYIHFDRIKAGIKVSFDLAYRQKPDPKNKKPGTWSLSHRRFVSVSLWAVEAALLHPMMKWLYVPLPLISAWCSHSLWRRRSGRLFTLVDRLCWRFGGTPNWQGINKCESCKHLTVFSVSPTTASVRSGYLFPRTNSCLSFRLVNKSQQSSIQCCLVESNVYSVSSCSSFWSCRIRWLRSVKYSNWCNSCMIKTNGNIPDDMCTISLFLRFKFLQNSAQRQFSGSLWMSTWKAVLWVWKNVSDISFLKLHLCLPGYIKKQLSMEFYF